LRTLQELARACTHARTHKHSTVARPIQWLQQSVGIQVRHAQASHPCDDLAWCRAASPCAKYAGPTTCQVHGTSSGHLSRQSITSLGLGAICHAYATLFNHVAMLNDIAAGLSAHPHPQSCKLPVQPRRYGGVPVPTCVSTQYDALCPFVSSSRSCGAEWSCLQPGLIAASSDTLVCVSRDRRPHPCSSMSIALHPMPAHYSTPFIAPTKAPATVGAAHC
jgi:hypothetical protein